VSVLNGPSNAANANVVVDESGYFAPLGAAAPYTVTTASPATVVIPTTVTYTASGLPATGTVNISLFPGSGPNAPVGNTFTVGALNAAAGAGTTSTGNAFISSVNGVATVGTPKFVNGTTPLSGSVTFIVSSPAPDSVIPVVFTGPSTTLTVGATGAPATGYAAGEGSAETWNAPLAASGPTTTLANPSGQVVVSLVNTAAGTFQGCAPAGVGTPFTPSTAVGACFTYTYTNAGDTYGYSSPAALSAAQFAQVLSGVATEASGPPAVPGDELAAFNYNASGPTAFAFGGVGTNGDVPATPTGVGVVAGTVANGGTIVTWTAPANPDVATYNVWRAPVGGAFAIVGPAVVGTTFSDNATTDPLTPPVAGTSYQYEVSAVATAGGGGQQGPLSTPFTFAPPGGGGATTPVINTIVVTAGSPGTALVTYNQAVTCSSNAGQAFSYSNTAGVPQNALAGASCAPGPGANAVTITFSAAGGTPPVGTTTGLAHNGDFVKYTAPATQTTANSVFAGVAAAPQYAATQTVTDNGTGTSPLQ